MGTTIRCNVNHLLLIVVVIESAWLGFWLFLLLAAPPGLARLPLSGPTPFQQQILESMPVIIFKPDRSDMARPETIAMGSMIGFSVIFLSTLCGLVLVSLGYNKSSGKYLKAYMAWLIVWNALLLIILIYASIEAADIPNKKFIKRPILRVKLKNRPGEGFMDYGADDPDDAYEMPPLQPLPSFIIVVKRLVRNLNWFLIPLIVLKGVFWIYQLIVTLLSIRYFGKQLNESSGGGGAETTFIAA